MHTQATYSLEALLDIKKNFFDELISANKARADGTKNSSSLAFIATSLPSKPLVEENARFQVLIIGGTLGGSALCIKKGNSVEVTEKELDTKVPSITSKHDFLEYIDSSLDKNVTVLAVNFAYPLEPVFENDKLDGILLDIGTTGKAISAPDLIGTRIGQSIESYIKEKHGKTLTVAVGNDSLCLSLAGKNLQGIDENKLGFGIVGTGVNFGFYLERDLVVNLESHAFDKFQPSALGRELAEKYGSPFGKETNGENLYKHFNFFLDENRLDFQRLSSTDQLDEIIRKDIPPISKAAQSILARSAQMVACQITAIMEFKKSDMVFVMEGGLFWKGEGYLSMVEEASKTISKYIVTFKKIENSNLFGAAKLVS